MLTLTRCQECEQRRYLYHRWQSLSKHRDEEEKIFNIFYRHCQVIYRHSLELSPLVVILSPLYQIVATIIAVAFLKQIVFHSFTARTRLISCCFSTACETLSPLNVDFGTWPSMLKRGRYRDETARRFLAV